MEATEKIVIVANTPKGRFVLQSVEKVLQMSDLYRIITK